MPAAPRISLVTALHGCVDLTRAFLESVERTLGGTDYEHVLVEDASEDATPELLRGLAGPRYRIAFNRERRGYAASNNRGARMARGDVLAFLNNDLVVRGDWLRPMVEGLERDARAGIVGNVQRDPRTGRIDHAGVYFDLRGHPHHARRGWRRAPRAEYTEWNAVTAACIVMRRATFEAARGFDEAYLNGCEDVDLCIRLRRMGLRHWVANRSVIDHWVSSSPGRHRHNDRNARILLDRWAALAAQWGEREWPANFLADQAHRWRRIDRRRTWIALRMLAGRAAARIRAPAARAGERC